MGVVMGVGVVCARNLLWLLALPNSDLSGSGWSGRVTRSGFAVCLPARWTELCTVNCRGRHVPSRPGLPDFRHLALQVVVSVHGNRAYLTLTRAAPADGRQAAPNFSTHGRVVIDEHPVDPRKQRERNVPATTPSASRPRPPLLFWRFRLMGGHLTDNRTLEEQYHHGVHFIGEGAMKVCRRPYAQLCRRQSDKPRTVALLRHQTSR